MDIAVYRAVILCDLPWNSPLSYHLLLQGLVKCIGSIVLAGIMRRIAEHHRYVTGGFPDLTVWNPDTKKFKAGADIMTITVFWFINVLLWC